MDTIVDAINLNHEGLQYLFAADDEKAIASLTKAIMLVQKWPELDETNLLMSMNNCDDEIMEQCRSTSTTTTTTSPRNVMEPTSQPLPCLDDNMFYIYNRPITIDASSLSSIIDDIQTNGNDAIREYSACIIFNVALAYHRHGMKHLEEYAASAAARTTTTTTTSSPSSPTTNNNAKAIGDACIQKAKTLYCTIIKLLCVASGVVAGPSSNSSASSSSSPLNMTHKSSMVVFVAAHNNLSYILRNIVGQIELANEGMHCIATLVDQLRDHHQKQIQKLQLQQATTPTINVVSHNNNNNNMSMDHKKGATTNSSSCSNGFAVFQTTLSSVSPVDTIRECIDGVERNLLVISCAAAPVA